MSESNLNRSLRMLGDLRVIDLRNELESRGIEKSGIKQALIERLRKTLVDGGHDPTTFTFEIPASSLLKSKKVDSSQEACIDLASDEVDGNNSHQITIRFEEDETDILSPKSTEDLSSISAASNATSNVLQQQQTLMEEQIQADGDVARQADSSQQPQITSATPATTTTPSTNLISTSSSNEFVIVSRAETLQNVVTQAPAIQCAPTIQHNIVISIDAEEDEVVKVKQENDQESEVQNLKATVNDKTQEAENNVLKEKSVPAVANQSTPTVIKTTSEGNNLWVSGLTSTTRAADLKNLFTKHGKVLGAKVVTNAKSPGSKCYGFVTMSSSEDAGECIKQLNRTELHGRIISIERAKSGLTVNTALDKKPVVIDASKSSEVVKISESTAVLKKDEEKKMKKLDDDKKKVNGGRKNERGRRFEWKNKPRMGRNNTRGSFNNNQQRRISAMPIRNNINFMNGRRNNNMLTLDMIRETRERERGRDLERMARQEDRRQQEIVMREKERLRNVERMQREEACRLAREKEKLRLEKQKLELERIAAERERFTIERERQRKLEREREERRRQAVRHPTERKESKRSEDSWLESKRKVISTSSHFPSSVLSKGSYVGHSNSVTKRSNTDNKKSLVNKSRHVIDSRGSSQRDASKTRKMEEKSRLEWRSVSKNDQTSHRSSRYNSMPAPQNYPYSGGWSSSTRQLSATQWPSAMSYSSFGTTPACMPPPASTNLPNYSLSRTSSNRYEPYKTSRRY